MVSPSLRTVVATASLIPAAVAVATFSLPSHHSHLSLSSRFPIKFNLHFNGSFLSALAPRSLESAPNLFHPQTDLHLESSTEDYIAMESAEQTRVLPEVMYFRSVVVGYKYLRKAVIKLGYRTEFMVDMKCEGCVSSVKKNMLKLNGVSGIDVDLSNQVVRVIGSVPLKTMLDSFKEMGQTARLIGQGNLNDFIVSAAVAEFKGPEIYGVVRFAQVNMELARIDASFTGLSSGMHGWSINEYGDLTRGVASTGKCFNPPNHLSEKPLGDLGTLEAGESGESHFSGTKEKIRVSELIGRSISIYEKEDRSDSGIAAAVLARSAGVGENYKRICTCDGVTIWESR